MSVPSFSQFLVVASVKTFQQLLYRRHGHVFMAPRTTLTAPVMPQPLQNSPTENIRGKYSIITNTQNTVRVLLQYSLMESRKLIMDSGRYWW